MVPPFCTGAWDQISRTVGVIREMDRIGVDNVLDDPIFLASLLQSENLLGSATAFHVGANKKVLATDVGLGLKK